MSYSVEFGAGAWAFALAAAVVALFLWHARQSRAAAWLLALRGAAVLSLALLATRPTLATRQPQRSKPRLLVLIDASHAMQAKAGRSSRLDAALAWLRKNRDAVDSRAEPVFFALSDRGRKLAGWEALPGLRTSNAAFHPSDALQDVADDPASGASRAWLLSDGNAEPAPDLEAALAGIKAPADVLGVGPARRGREVSFVEIKTPDFAFLHGRFDVLASVEAAGLAGRALDLRLFREDPVRGTWAPVEARRVSLASDYETVQTTFSAAAQTLGSERYRLEAAPEGPASLARSRQFRIEVIRQKYRVMYLAGRPSAEYAYLRDFLKSDPNHELVSFVILRNPENPAFVPDNELSLIPFPAQEIFVQNLSQFDLFILENFAYSRFQLPAFYLESLKSFVAAGGALLVIGGENAFISGGYRGTALEEMLPVTLSGAAPDFVPGLFEARPAAQGHPLVQLYETPEASKAA